MKLLRISLILFAILALMVVEVYSQCPMCRMTVESNYADGGTAALGLNRGIIYLFAAPYLVVGTIAFIYWRSQQSVDEPSDKLA